jgi:hypothetical protein
VRSVPLPALLECDMISCVFRPWRLLGALALAAAAAPAMAGAGWERVVPASVITGVDGKTYAPQCTGYPGTDNQFSFWVQRTASRNVLVYFEGGGACWDNLTCTYPLVDGLPPQVPQFFIPAVVAGTDPAGFDGIFKDDPANPVRDWNKVYIPYCSGDIHVGSASRDYVSVGHPLFPLPAGTPFRIEHRGFDNFMAVLAWTRQNMGQPKDVLVAGSSAGGYGATANFPWIQETFKTAQVSVIADASQGITTPTFDQSTPGRGSWNPQLAPGVFGADLSMLPGEELMRRAALAYPRVKAAQFTTRVDGVQIGFYGVTRQFYPPGGSCPFPAADWNQQMLAALTADAALVRNYRYYLAEGSYHTLLRSPLFYSEDSAGESFGAWVTNMLKNRGGTGGNGGGWNSLACPGCLTPLPCEP